MTTPHTQAVEAAVQRLMGLAQNLCHIDKERLETAIRAELNRPQEVACQHVFHHFGDQTTRRCVNCGVVESNPLEVAAVGDAEIEQAARMAFHPDLDWSNDGNLFASAVQRTYFHLGAKWALAASRAQEVVRAEPIRLEDIEQYRMQMAGISTAALGYWKEGESIHPDYDTLTLRDVAKLYAKYDALFKARILAAQPKDPAPVPVAVPWLEIDDIDEMADRYGDHDKVNDCYSFNREGRHSVRALVAEVMRRASFSGGAGGDVGAVTAGNERQHFICVCPDCIKPTPTPEQGDAKDARPDYFHSDSGECDRVHGPGPVDDTRLVRLTIEREAAQSGLDAAMKAFQSYAAIKGVPRRSVSMASIIPGQWKKKLDAIDAAILASKPTAGEVK